jgi:UDP:flavonoid glycosyltransferase YjiC (YdhE family)
MKPTILIFPFELMAHYARCLVVAEYLEKHFRVLFQASCYDELVHRAGFATFHADRLPERALVADCKTTDLLAFAESDLERVMLAQRATIERFDPAFVIGDMSVTLSMAAEAAGVPYVSLVNSYLSRYYGEEFPVPSCLTNFSADIADVPPFFRPRIESFDGLVAVTRAQRGFKRLRKRYGLRPKTNFAMELEGDQTWICDAPALHPVRADLPDSVRVIGPLLYFPNWAPIVRQRFHRPGRPTVLVSMGSSGAWDIVTQLSAPELSHIDFIVCGQSSPAVTGPNIYSLAFANFEEVLPEVDVVLCHGGNGTVYQALSHGIPCLGIPQFFEQAFNMEKVVARGWGQKLAGTETATQLRDVIERWANRRLSLAERMVEEPLKRQIETIRQSARQVAGSEPLRVEPVLNWAAA